MEDKMSLKPFLTLEAMERTFLQLNKTKLLKCSILQNSLITWCRDI